MSGLHEELDQALRAVPLPGAPVERARRDGRRLRNRRRVAVVAGALAVAAVAAGYPALAGNFTAAPTRPAVSQTTKPSHDPVVTDGPPAGATHGAAGLASADKMIAQGKIGTKAWQAALGRSASPGPGEAGVCYEPSGADHQGQLCGSVPSLTGGEPAALLSVGDGGTQMTDGVAASDVTYLVVSFTDGQQLKLLPVTTGGHRYFAWAAPTTMTVARLTAYLGGPYSANGQTETAVPFDLAGQGGPTFGLWQRPGQAAPPRAQAALAHGGTGSQAWSVTGYEGPWGTCWVISGSAGGSVCDPVSRLGATTVTGYLSADAVTGSAAAGVALVKVTAADGTSAEAKPVAVGNERLFTVAIDAGSADFTWAAYNAAGQEVGHGTGLS